MNNDVEMMRTELLETREPFSTVFPVLDDVAEMVTARMKKSGFDHAHPICVWRTDKPVVLDGHTRLRVARTLGLREVPVIQKDFKDVAAALDYAIAQQVERRNLTLFEMVKYIEVADEFAKRGRKKLEPTGSNLSEEQEFRGKSSERLAKALHIPTKRAERLRRVVKDGSAEIRKALCEGEISLSKAYDDTLALKASRTTVLDAPKSAPGIVPNAVSETVAVEDGGIAPEPPMAMPPIDRSEVLMERLRNAVVKVVRYERLHYPNSRYSNEKRAVMETAAMELFKSVLNELAPNSERELE